MRQSLRYLSACILLLGASQTSANAQVRITDDVGGRITTYIESYAAVRASGQRVIIDGQCLSACTLVLGIVPRERICATPRSTLGFHAAWMPGPAGKPIPSALGTAILRDTYPPHVNKWVKSRGGLNGKMIFARGRDLRAVVPICKDAPQDPWSSPSSWAHAGPG